MDDLDRLLNRVKQQAHGLMPVPVYRRIFETAADRGGAIVEIGTYRGAATIALALGARQSGKPFRVLTADLLVPGVGAVGDSDAEKFDELRRTFESFGVSEWVQFIHGTSAELVAEADPRDIGLLLLDGGGRLEADLALLWDRLAPGCAIIVDDVDDRVVVRRGWRRAMINQKHRLSKLLTDRFVEAGMLVPRGSTFSTAWYDKGEAVIAPADIERLALPAYHQLIRAPIAASEFGWRRNLLRDLAAVVPGLARFYRRLRG